METILDLPEDLMREVRRLAVMEGRQASDIISESLRRDFGIGDKADRPSLRDFVPVSVGKVKEANDSDDRLEGMLNDRGHRY
jgi:hypothetical protein